MTSTNDAPRLSVVVPIHNAEPYLQECLDSILSQTFEDFELILVDDGSSDGSLRIIQKYAKKDPRIVFTSQINSGVAGAMNKAIAMSHCEYIARFDADDIMLPNSLNDLVNTCLDHPDAIVVCGDYQVITEAGAYSHTKLTPIRDTDIKLALLVRNPIGNGGTLVKKSLVQEIGGIPSDFAEDYLVWTKLWTKGTFIGTGTTLFKWRLNPRSLTHSNLALTNKVQADYANMLWRTHTPALISRSEILAGKQFYSKCENAASGRISMYLQDIARNGTQFIRNKLLVKGFVQLAVLATSGTEGVKAALGEVWLLLARNMKKLRPYRG